MKRITPDIEGRRVISKTASIQVIQVLLALPRRMSSLSAAFGLTGTTISAPSADAPTAMAPEMGGPIIGWPTWMQDPARQQDDYELTFEDIGDKIWRYRGEKIGRTYASHYPYDLETDVWRRVFKSYPNEVQDGTAQPAADHHSGVFWRDIRLVREEIKALEANPRAGYSVLPRADAEPGTN